MAKDDNKPQAPISVNTFSGGMNKDISKYVLPANEYYDASNIRIVADSGKESAALVNIQGNEFSIEIPCSPSVFELILDVNINLTGVPWSITFSLNVAMVGGTDVWSLTVAGTGGNPVQSIGTALQLGTGWLLNGVASATGPNNVAGGASGFYWIYDQSSKRIIFWGKPSMPNPLLQPTSLPMGVSTVQQVISIGITGNYTVITTLASPQCSVSVIGYAVLRDSIYLFTTSHDGGTPSAAGGPGQIWKLDVLEGMQTVGGILTYIQCIYTRDQCINFTKQHPIEALGRYEKIDIQGIYWTDNFNPPRKLNVASANAMSVPCEFLDLAPKTGFSIPILDSIPNGGEVLSGVYQLTYRYKNSEGQVTDWSPLSNLVPMFKTTDADRYCEIQGGEYDMDTLKGTSTGKRIRWTISDLDTSFEFIELCAVYHSDDIPGNEQFYIFQELTNGLTVQTVEHTGNEDFIPLTAIEFITGIGATFETVKTLSSKDNKLFFGNIVNTTFHIEYDARAYRFDVGQLGQLDSLSDLPVVVNGALPYTPAPGQTAIDLVPTQHDCINPYNDENPATNPNWFASDQYIYQLDGLTLGGEGHNISYKFITETNEEDTINDSIQPGAQWQNPYIHSFVWCDINQFQPQAPCFAFPVTQLPGTRNLGIPNQVYNMNNTFDNMKSPFKWSLYGSYARGETYRFGIIFYNNKGQASFVNWIGDIKIPFSYQEGAGNPFGQFQVSTWIGHAWSPTFLHTDDSTGFRATESWEGILYTNQIGLEFSVNLDPATSGINVTALGITGFSIVRCDRTDSDKSKFGHGLAHTVDKLQMDETQWDNMPNPEPNLWGVTNSDSVLIPSCGQYIQWCGGPYLNYCDAATYNANNTNVCDNAPFFPAAWLGYKLCKTRKTELLLYGPLGWKNSDTTNTGNLDTGLGISSMISQGDYLKIESVMAPQYNYGMGMGGWIPTNMTGVQIPWKRYGNNWFKYYYGVNMVGGILGANPIGLLYSYTNGIPSSLTAQDPANNRMHINWGTHVGDGLFIPANIDSSLDFAFNNVSHPGEQINYSILSPGNNWISNRPHSIGSECYLFTLDDASQWLGAKWLMGASLDAFSTACTWPAYRGIFSYEKYNIPYGGNTFANRANSTYISSNNFYPITPLTLLTVPIVSDCWGGDVQCQLYDFNMYEKNWGQTPFRNWDTLVADGYTGGGLLDSGGGWGDSNWGIQWNCIYPAEVHLRNVLWRTGYHFNSKADGNDNVPDDGTLLHDEFLLMSAYNTNDDIRNYFPKPLNVSLGDEFDTRIYYSETKINGEAVDSWAVFLQNNYKDVEGVYGPINKLIRLNETMYYFQDTGFGALSVNPTAMIQADDGTSLQLGTIGSGAGAFIQSFKYISTLFGAKQQWAVTHSDNALYFFDINQRKLFTYSGEGTLPVSDLTGLHSYFQDHLIGTVLTKDNPILKEGISCVYDAENNEVLYTFHDKGYAKRYDNNIIFHQVVGVTPNRLISIIIRPSSDTCNECMTQNCSDYGSLAWPAPGSGWIYLDDIYINNIGPFSGVVAGMIGCPALPIPVPNPQGFVFGDIMIWLFEPWNNFPPGILPDAKFNDIDFANMQTLSMGCGIGTNSFTVAYNELVKGFTSFYDFHPSIYINSGKYLLTPNTQSKCMSTGEFGEHQLYMHGLGSYGRFYDIIYQSSVTLASNMQSTLTKVFDNVSYHMESLWIEGNQDNWWNSVGAPPSLGLNGGSPFLNVVDIPGNTFDTIRFYTDYQMTDYVTLVPGTNVRKIEREWQMMVPRNIMNENLIDADIFNVFNYNPNRLFKDRMRDKYLFIDLIYNNFDRETGEPRNIKFILHYFKTFFRPSYR